MFVAHEVDHLWRITGDVHILFVSAALEEGKEKLVNSQ